MNRFGGIGRSHQSELMSPTENDIALHDDEIRQAHRSLGRRRWLGRLGIGVVSVPLVSTLVLHSDIAFNRILNPDTQPLLHSIDEAIDPDNDASSTFFIDGFGNQDGTYFAKELTDAMQAEDDSHIVAVEYGNHSIDIDDITDNIAAEVLQNSTEHVNLTGYSIGGIVAIKVAVTLYEKYNILTDTITLLHTPFSEDSIQAKMRTQGNVALEVIEGFLCGKH